MDKTKLAAFLRARREALRPADVGLVAKGRRRTPGLRREEVAGLAGMTADYYLRLELGRAAQPSPKMVAALARALRWDFEGFSELCRLAGVPEPRDAETYLEPGILYLLDTLREVPAWAQDEATQIVGGNPLCDAIFGELPTPGDPRCALAWQWFAEGRLRELVRRNDQRDISLAIVTEVRNAAAWRVSGDERTTRLVHDLRDRSQDFARLWDSETVTPFKPLQMTIDHPEVGSLELTCDMMRFWTGHLVKVLRPRLGTPTAGRLIALRASREDPRPDEGSTSP